MRLDLERRWDPPTSARVRLDYSRIQELILGIEKHFDCGDLGLNLRVFPNALKVV